MSIFTAESAEDNCFMFAVDPPITLADRKDGKNKDTDLR